MSRDRSVAIFGIRSKWLWRSFVCRMCKYFRWFTTILLFPRNTAWPLASPSGPNLLNGPLRDPFPNHPNRHQQQGQAQGDEQSPAAEALGDPGPQPSAEPRPGGDEQRRLPFHIPLYHVAQTAEDGGEKNHKHRGGGGHMGRKTEEKHHHRHHEGPAADPEQAGDESHHKGDGEGRWPMITISEHVAVRIGKLPGDAPPDG